jgi:hypothetical protein
VNLELIVKVTAAGVFVALVLVAVVAVVALGPSFDWTGIAL